MARVLLFNLALASSFHHMDAIRRVSNRSRNVLGGNIVGSSAQHLSSEIQTIFSSVKYGIQHFGNLPKTDYAVCTDEDSRSSTTLLTLQAGLPEEYVKLMRANRLKYAKKHGVRYCEYSHSLDESRELVWSKILAIQELFKKQHPTVMWMDADAIIMNHDESVDDMVAKYAKDVILAAEFTYERGTAPRVEEGKKGSINLGVFMIKNTEFSATMLQSVYEDTSFLKAPNAEQDGLINFANKNVENFAEHAVIVPWNEFNSLHDQYQSGDFIIHWAGGRWGTDKYEAMLTEPPVHGSDCC